MSSLEKEAVSWETDELEEHCLACMHLFSEILRQESSNNKAVSVLVTAEALIT
jgi:hypothetical protein